MESPHPAPAICTRDLRVRYAGRRRRQPPVDALKGVDVECARGEIVGVLGPNGSGKTTLFKVLSGSLIPTSGEARVLDLPPQDRSLVPRVGYQPEGPLPFPHLNAEEFLHYFADLAGIDRAAARASAARWLDELGLGEVRRRAVGTFSSGMQKRLALATALLPDPEVLLLDEPTAGLDPTGSLLVIEVLREIAEAGTAVLMASHHLQEVEQTCDRVHILSAGHIVASGRLSELLQTDEEQLRVRGADAAARSRIEAAARETGCEVLGWERGRRHLFELFRRLGDGSAAVEPGRSEESE